MQEQAPVTRPRCHAERLVRGRVVICSNVKCPRAQAQLCCEHRAPFVECSDGPDGHISVAVGVRA